MQENGEVKQGELHLGGDSYVQSLNNAGIIVSSAEIGSYGGITNTGELTVGSLGIRNLGTTNLSSLGGTVNVTGALSLYGGTTNIAGEVMNGMGCGASAEVSGNGE